jgi:4-hydroxybenzoate polyprenyltransferase
MLLFVGFGFAFIDIFSGTYNDYQDYELDLRNKRKDKWIIAGLVTRKQMLYISLVFLFFGLDFLYLTNFSVLFLGIVYSILMWGYSYPSIPLKRNISTYMLLASIYLILPYLLTTLFNRSFTVFDFFFGLFCFSQSMYLYSQKDSTDLKDHTNIFLQKGWRIASLLCILFGIFTSMSLFVLSFLTASSLFVWGINSFLKFYLMKSIYKGNITKKYRDRIVLFEFLTPYLYVLGGLL